MELKENVPEDSKKRVSKIKIKFIQFGKDHYYY